MENNLTQFSLKNILIWTCAFCIMEFPMRYFYLKIVGGKNVEKWYNFKDFSIYNVVAGDLFYVLVGIIITYKIYNHFFKNENNIYKFFAIFLAVQIAGDLTFYKIVSNLPNNYHNKWVKFFINYGKTSGINAVIGDSIYILVWTTIAYLIRNLALDYLLAILFSFMFVISAISES